MFRYSWFLLVFLCSPIWMKLTFRSCTPWRRYLLPYWSLGWFGHPVSLSSASEHIVRAIRRRSAQFAVSGQIDVRAKRNPRAPRAFSKMGHAHRIRLLGSSDVLPLSVDRYVKDAAHSNLLKQAKRPLHGMASAFHRYASLRELRKVTHFPIREEVAIQWSSMFGNAATSENYFSLLEKCCFPPKSPPHGGPTASNMSLRVWRSVRTRAPATQTSFVAPFAGASLRTRPRRVNSPRRPFLIPLPP